MSYHWLLLVICMFVLNVSAGFVDIGDVARDKRSASLQTSSLRVTPIDPVIDVQNESQRRSIEILIAHLGQTDGFGCHYDGPRYHCH